MIRVLMVAGLLWLSAGEALAAGRAVWTWEEDSYAMVESSTAAERAFAFLESQGVDTVYLYADAFEGRNLIAQAPQRYRDFIATAHRRGFRVYALLGSAFLRTEEYILPAKRPQALAMVQRVLDYNAAATADARFDGINFDIEPHLLDQWDTQRLELLGHFLDMGAAFMQAKRDAGSDIPIGPAIPFWLDGTSLIWKGEFRPVSEHAIDLFDYVALMDYRNKAEGGDGIISHAQTEMDYADRVRKQVVIGLELGKSDPPKVTFQHLDEARLEREVAATLNAYRARPAFAGFVLHHYGTYREWIYAQRKTKKR